MTTANQQFAIYCHRNYPYGTPYVPLDGILLESGGKRGYKPVIFPFAGSAKEAAKRLNDRAAAEPLADGQLSPTKHEVIEYNPVYVIVYETVNYGDATVERFVGPDGKLVGKDWKAKQFSSDAAARSFITYELNGLRGDIKHLPPMPKEAYTAALVRHVY